MPKALVVDVSYLNRENGRMRTPSPTSNDILRLYQSYPRKRGRTPGLVKAERLIKSWETYDAVVKAIANYKLVIEREGTEEKFVLYFSSFMNQYEDYLDDEVLESAKLIDVSHLRWEKP